VCFEFVSDTNDFPDVLKDWPTVVSQQGLRVYLFNANSPEKPIAQGTWSGLQNVPQARVIWRGMMSDTLGLSTRWIASDTRPVPLHAQVRTYSVRDILSGWAKTQTMTLLRRRKLPQNEQLTFTQRENQAYADFFAFHSTPEAWDKQTTDARNQSPVKTQTMGVSDFTHIASQHPGLARRVGLNCDVTIPVSSELLRSQDLLLRAAVMDQTFDRPYTACAFTAKNNAFYFLPRPAPTDDTYVEGVGGLLKMRRKMPDGSLSRVFYLETLDYVASLHRGEAVASGLDSALTEFTRDIPSGFGIIRDGIPSVPDDIRQTKITLSNGEQPYVLFAAALMRGYRVDLKTRNLWFSQCSRRVFYQAPSMPKPLTFDEADEGCITPHPVTNDGNGAQQHEEIGRVTAVGGLAALPDGKLDNGIEVPPGYVGNVSYRVKLPYRRLAKPRHWQEYVARIRPVYSGGYSLAFSEGTSFDHDEEAVTDTHRFRRTHFVNAPIVITDPKHPGLCNESSATSHTKERRLICSLDSKMKSALRFVHPPVITEEELVLTGALDSMLPDASYKLLSEFAGSRAQSASDHRGIPDPDAIGLRVTLSLRGHNAAKESMECPAPGNSVDLLPDCPVVLSVPFYQPGSQWPAYTPVKFVLHATKKGASKVKVDEGRNLFSVLLSPGTTVDCQLDTIPRTHDMPRVTQEKRAPDLQSLRQDYVLTNALRLDILDQRSESLLTAADVGAASGVSALLKHAAKKPRIIPQFGSPVVIRELGQRIAKIRDTPLFDEGSTGKIFVKYAWDEITCADVPGGTVRESKAGTSEEVQVGEELENIFHESVPPSQIDFNLLFNDTKARDIRLKPVADGSLGGCFPSIPPSERIVEGDEARITIPNSGVPPVANVRFALPLTAFQRSNEHGIQRTMRTGNAIRMYLSDCWRVTGEREMLGIVCAPESQEALSDVDRRNNEQFFSQWGAEVLFDTAALEDGPFAHHFPNAAMLFDGVNSITPEEAKKNPGLKRAAIVAAHAVRYDDAQHCWFADVQVSRTSQSFLPWLRFGLVRFQPDSIPGCHVSPVTLSAFCQMLPDRTVTIVRSGTDTRRLLITVAGIGPITMEAAQDRLQTRLEVLLLLPVENTKELPGEIYPDEQGNLWAEYASAVLRWNAKRDGNGAYSGEIWTIKPKPGKTRLLIRESLISKSATATSGRPILLESVVI
jgi:hypothetical protein